MNIILYSRVSTDEQAEGSSLAFQESAMRNYCTLRDHTVIEAYKEDYSAKDFNRPEIKKILKFCKANKSKVDKILVLRWDRFSRSLEYALTNIRLLRDIGIEVNSVEQPIDFNAPDWPLLLGVHIGVAEADNNKRGEATQDGIHQSRMQGKCTNKAPRGYLNRKTDKRNKWVEIDEKTAPIIKAIFNEVAEGIYAPNFIREKYWKKGLKINKNSFPEMLRNRFYIGEILVPAYKHDVEQHVQGKHEPLIDKATFFRVQDVLGYRKKNYPKVCKKIDPDLYLKSFLKCPVCGATITGDRCKGNGGIYLYYKCIVDGKHCRIPAPAFNDTFNSYLGILKPNPTVMKLYEEVLLDIKKERFSDINRELEELQKELAAKNEHLNKIDDRYFISGDMDAESYNRIKTRLLSEINGLKSKIELIKTPKRTEIEPKLKYSMSLISNLEGFMGTATAEAKVALISSLFPQKLEFDGKTVRTNGYNAVLDLIYQNTNELREHKKTEAGENPACRSNVPRADTQP